MAVNQCPKCSQFFPGSIKACPFCAVPGAITRQALGARIVMEQKHLTVNACALMLDAADRVQARIDAGETRESAYAAEYVPTRVTARIARYLRLNLTVVKGEWVTL